MLVREMMEKRQTELDKAVDEEQQCLKAVQAAQTAYMDAERKLSEAQERVARLKVVVEDVSKELEGEKPQ